MTKFLKKDDLNSKWFEIDATGAVVGRLATVVSKILRGKNKATFTPHMDMGDFVIVINAEKVNVTGQKEDSKKYWHHTGYPGGQKESSLKQVRASHPDRIIKNAVKGMLPHNRLGRQLNTHLKVYAGSQHPHSAQKPQLIQL